ncbi:hypothetical protein ACIQVK_19555 [Streptomyces sp. NPDC090493]|uniref:hypothetical protein n=1 Tax=Streptomyces sp. NPDC090493 TaxID=3365964 RepID=UPI003827FD1A
MSTTTRFLRRTVPVALGATLAAAALSTTPAAADSGYWVSTNGGASGKWTTAGERVTACDIKVDGYMALVQILTLSDSLVYSQLDKDVDHKCTTTHKGLFTSPYKIRVCTVKTGGRPVNCSAKHEFDA